MKTFVQVKNETKFGNVYSRERFIELLNDGWFTPYDGDGIYHDGENETRISVWSVPIDATIYPYVIWFNK